MVAAEENHRLRGYSRLLLSCHHHLTTFALALLATPIHALPLAQLCPFIVNLLDSLPAFFMEDILSLRSLSSRPRQRKRMRSLRCSAGGQERRAAPL
jgi:hypothetical protein